MITRRKFVGISVAGVSGLAVGAWWLKDHLSLESLFSQPESQPDDPIQILKDPAQTEFTGDNVHRAHEYLWKRQEWMDKVAAQPPSIEKAKVVIIGGGISGLTAAYQLRDLKPIILEQALQFGGNSKGESWEKVPYSIGAAYIGLPDPEAPSTQFLDELGLSKDYRILKEDSAAVIFRGKRVEGFWEGKTDPARAEEFKRARAAFKDVLENSYPAIPPKAGDAMSVEALAELDSISLRDWMQNKVGDLHPHVEEFIELYCWSTYGASMREISAAQGLAFISADLEGIAVFPGGNARISQQILRKLEAAELKPGLRAGCMVLDVAHQGDRVAVTYVDGQGNFQQIHADACVMATPKFIAAKVISTPLNPGQLEAIQKIRYRAYLVGNILIRGKLESHHYDSFILRGGLEKGVQEESLERGFTDVIMGGWASHDKANASVLTLYQGIPFEGGRPLILGMTLDQARTNFSKNVPDLLKALGIGADRIASVRMSRWGHPLCASDVGLIAEGWLERARQPIGNRIFFAQQDNWGSPGYECAYSAGAEAASAVRRLHGAHV